MENHAPAPRNTFPIIRSSLFFLSIASLNGGEELGKSDGKLAFEKIDLQMRKTKKPRLRKSGSTSIKETAPPLPPEINSSSTTSSSLENTLDR
ncbi:MAG: hypothetical protein CBC46_00310 [Verrucomicrobiaceae bacterium TMED86]|nr:MAG: hypothetical protein CBC46_00310 [Verrucomicrobiaceae bacterium TMED86]